MRQHPEPDHSAAADPSFRSHDRAGIRSIPSDGAGFLLISNVCANMVPMTIRCAGANSGNLSSIADRYVEAPN